MTEQQIKDGYDRLDGALAAPLDVQERVARRVRVRRRRRQAAAAGAAALGLVVVVGTALVLGGGDDSGTVAVDQPSGPTSTLLLTRPDGSTYSFPDVTVSCTPPRVDGGDPLGSGPGRIWLWSPIHLVGTGDDARVTEPFVYLEAIVDEIAGDRTFTWPNDWSMDTDRVPLTLFVADSEGRPRSNETSTNEAAARGTVHVLEASCDPEPVLRLEVDATLGSEVGQGTLHVGGTAG